MAILETELYSECLGMRTGLLVIAPEETYLRNHRAEKAHPALYLLHGGGYNYTSIIRDTGLHALVQDIFPGLFVIMPQLDFSYAMNYKDDCRYAYQYEQYLSCELPEIARTLFPLSQRKEDTAISGWSMGGFGAIVTGFNHPELFGHVGTQCGMVDMVWGIETREYMRVKYQRLFGQALEVRNSPYDCFALTKKAAAETDAGKKPTLFQAWTYDDYLRQINEDFHRHCVGLDLDYTWYLSPGKHGWGEHDAGLRAFLLWLKEKMEGNGHAGLYMQL